MKKEKKKPDNKWSTIVKAPYKRPPLGTGSTRYKYYTSLFRLEAKLVSLKKKKFPTSVSRKRGCLVLFFGSEGIRCMSITDFQVRNSRDEA